MWLRFWTSIPLNTPVTTPHTHAIEVPEGVVHKIRMRYLGGPRGMVSSAVFLGTTKMFPLEGSDWFEGDDEWVDGDVYVINKKGWSWSIVGYSPGTTYAHRVYVDLFVLPEEKASPWMILSDFVKIMKRLMGLG